MAAFPTSVATDSDLYIAVNAVSTQLTDNPLTSGAATVNVTSTAAFPTVGFISIDNEIIKYTGKTGTSFTGCTRGADGTAASSHVQNSQVFHNVIAVHHNALKDDLIATEQFISDVIGRTNTQIRTPAGSQGTPSHSFAGDTDTGLYNPGANELGITAGGTIIADFLFDGTNKFVTASTTRLQFGDGTLALPAYSFSGDTNTGIYRVGADHMVLVAGGGAAIDIDPSGFIINSFNTRFPDGTAAIPGLTFSADTNTGFYRSTTDTFFAVAGGTQVARFTFDGTTPQLIVGSGTLTAPSLCIAGNSGHGFYRDPGLDITASSVPLAVPLGTAANPTFTFAGDENTGIYSAGADIMSFASAGSEVFRYTGGGIEMRGSNRIFNIAGSAGSPAYSFASTTTTGMYSAAGNTINFATNGVARMSIDTTSVTINIPLYMGNGSAAAPSHSFGGDPDTGLFTGSSNTLSVTIGGVETFRIEPANSANDIRMVVYDHTAGSLKGVSRGVADSGGTGFRLLRIVN